MVALACLLSPLGYARMFTGFHAYDDERIFLVALRDYLAGNPLMTPYVPLYGPFYYEVYGGLFKVLGIAPAHDSGRWITLVVWLAASVVGGLAMWRLTRKAWLALGAQMVTFTGLLALANEPTSTYALSTLLLIALVGIVVGPTRPRVAAVLIGAVVAVLSHQGEPRGLRGACLPFCVVRSPAARQEASSVRAHRHRDRGAPPDPDVGALA